MIVPAIPKYFGPERYDTLKIGETFSIDSGMGGSYVVEFEGATDDYYNFKYTNDSGWTVSIPKSNIHKQLYILVPDI